MPRDTVAAAHGVFEEKPTPRVTREELAEVVCPVPDPFTSSAEGERWEHTDLARLDAEGLWREFQRARLALVFADRPHPWVSERYRAARAELSCREREGDQP